MKSTRDLIILGKFLFLTIKYKELKLKYGCKRNFIINQIDNFGKDTYNLLNLMKELKIDLNMIVKRKNKKLFNYLILF